MEMVAASSLAARKIAKKVTRLTGNVQSSIDEGKPRR
jgi:hypothetical protein